MEDEEPLAGASDSGASRVPLEGGGCCEPAAAVGNHTPQPAGAGGLVEGEKINYFLGASLVHSFHSQTVAPASPQTLGSMRSRSVGQEASSSVKPQRCESQAPALDAEQLLSHPDTSSPCPFVSGYFSPEQSLAMHGKGSLVF